ncbi:hypothetical protein OG921_03065 [Aldersonia sp. NBC_00410]|uniref:hypothetical protein n=1 Tax=Aldersonia sp. NBC_00410 TaxID=2975954 RepID=UPI002257BD00|nr:hypothetical protein [Aldersonia sp. NBC_00410]MCX5042172.1 hypothetical protein [Aldersonia sp. NBC_00410]
MTVTPSPTFLAAADESGGAALDQVIGLSIAAMVVTAGLLWIAYLHRTHRITWLTRLGELAGKWTHRPPWAALPIFLFITTIVCALFGFIWDVSLHIGKGRDAGPLANPAHYFILVGLFLLFISGALSMILPFGRPGRAAVRITRGWYVPVGGLLLAGCGLYALIGFPLDDIWHRIFGQDVTLWGPTHLMLIGGAGLSLIAVLLLEREGRQAKPPDSPPDKLGMWLVRCLAFGGLVIGLSVFQIEYDFGVEQFRLVLQPMLIAGAAALALVAARLTLGPWAALVAAVFAAVLRGAVALLVEAGLGAPHSVFALYLGPAIVIELLALTPLFKRPIVFGVVGGLLVGTVGLWLESLWIDAVYQYPWPTGMWAEALAMAVPVAVLMGLCGGLLSMVLTGKPLPRRAVGVSVVVATVLVVGLAVGNGLRTTVPEDVTATVTLTELPSDRGQRMVSAEVQMNPNDAVSDDPEWVSILAWQGGLDNDRGLFINRLDEVGPGKYRSTEPVPVWGSWKTLLRLQDGTTMAAVPIYLPADPGIGATEKPAVASETSPFVEEIKVLQRERNFDHPSWLYSVASLVVLVCTLILIAALTWGAGRIAGSGSSAGVGREQRPRVQPHA